MESTNSECPVKVMESVKKASIVELGGWMFNPILLGSFLHAKTIMLIAKEYNTIYLNGKIKDLNFNFNKIFV